MFMAKIHICVAAIRMFVAKIRICVAAIRMFVAHIGISVAAIRMFVGKIDIAALETGLFAVATGVRAIAAEIHVRVSGSIRADARNRHAMPAPASAVMDVRRPVHDLSQTTT